MRYVKRIPEKSGQTEQRIRMPVGTLTHFALIRRWRDTFPTRGKAFFGCTDVFETAFELRWSGTKDSPVRPPSSVACGATFPLEGEGYYGGS